MSTICRLGRCYVGGSVARGFIFLVGFHVDPTFAVMLLLFAAVCSVSLVLAQFEGTHVWTGQEHIFATLPYKRRAPSWIKLKPEDLNELICKLARMGMTPSSINVTLEDSFGVPQVLPITGNNILRILKKEGLAPSIPEVLYFFVEKAKSIRKHLDKNRKDRDSKFRLILVECAAFTALRSTTDASGPCLPTGSTSLLRPRLELVTPPFSDECIGFFGRSKRFRYWIICPAFKECDPTVSVRRIEASFRKGRGGSSLSGIP